MGKLRYRPEIDGLRAIAVTVVILFHAGFDGLPGGFIGVDIFYVISGFLITRIISSGLDSNTFQFKQFYSRRIKRLFPAAFAMLTTTLLIGAFVLTPEEYVSLSTSALASAFFMANVYFLNKSGYFGPGADVEPLAHMWSLSLEEQFYLIFPLLLFLAYRNKGAKASAILIAVITAASLSFSIAITDTLPNFAFYMLPARIWELGLGALLVFCPDITGRSHRLSNVLTSIGLLMILFGVTTIRKYDIFPGYLALIPTIGTALIIYASPAPKNYVRR